MDFGLQLRQSICQFFSAHAGHDDIRQQQMNPSGMRLRARQRFFRICSCQHPITVGIEAPCHQQAHIFLVLRHQYRLVASSGLSADGRFPRRFLLRHPRQVNFNMVPGPVHYPPRYDRRSA